MINLLVVWSRSVNVSKTIDQPSGVQLNDRTGEEACEECHNWILVPEDDWHRCG